MDEEQKQDEAREAAEIEGVRKHLMSIGENHAAWLIGDLSNKIKNSQVYLMGSPVTAEQVADLLMEYMQKNFKKRETIVKLEAEILELKEINKKMERMIDNGLGWEDMKSDGARGEGV